MLEILLFLITFAMSWAGVGVYRRWSERKGIIDLPNDRSSHTIPTPRGGGLVIALICLVGYIASARLGGAEISWGYIAGSLVVVGISWLDDIRSVDAMVRFACHLLASLLLVSDTGTLRELEIPGISSALSFGWLAPVITVLWIVWLINAYNFMDGIDGIAGTQAVIAGLGWAVVAYSGAVNGLYYFGLIIAASSLGFLIHNWQPAKVFMGDAGSALLGFTFAAAPLLATEETRDSAARFALMAPVLVWFFLFDSGLTLMTRLIGGQRIWTPHREHLYQRLVRSGRSHASVSVIYGMLALMLTAVFVPGRGLIGISGLLPLLLMVALSFGLSIYTYRKNVLT